MIAPEVSCGLEPLSRHHDRAAFRCGVEALDRYLHTLASQDMRRKANAVFVLVPEDAPYRIAGYFTLCAYSLAPGSIPAEAQKQMPRYPMISATLIGRFAISSDMQGQGWGSRLMAKALQKAYENADVVGSSMVVVDAIDDRAVRFYQAHGFIKLPESMRLVLPMSTIRQLLE
ncbi:MAG TPA: GNAT family N-acetyltransferase [Terriglobales bacterium]|nr:GNAT family N-acetyltransferase [Terriglobales bacterium]